LEAEARKPSFRAGRSEILGFAERGREIWAWEPTREGNWTLDKIFERDEGSVGTALRNRVLKDFKVGFSILDWYLDSQVHSYYFLIISIYFISKKY